MNDNAKILEGRKLIKALEIMAPWFEKNTGLKINIPPTEKDVKAAEEFLAKERKAGYKSFTEKEVAELQALLLNVLVETKKIK